jgi:hypothetical protein
MWALCKSKFCCLWWLVKWKINWWSVRLEQKPKYTTTTYSTSGRDAGGLSWALGRYSHLFTNVIHSHRRHQKGIPTYAFWALALDPWTKRKVSKILQEDDIARNVVRYHWCCMTTHTKRAWWRGRTSRSALMKKHHFLLEWMKKWIHQLHYQLQNKF